MWKWKCALLVALLFPLAASAQPWRNPTAQPWRNPTAWSEQRRREQEEERNRMMLLARSAAHAAQHFHFNAPRVHTPAPGSTRSFGGSFGGTLAAIGGGIAALFGAIFGRKK
jgi:hypothetical protein